MAQSVKCPECRCEVELPAKLKQSHKYYCPDCDVRLPVRLNSATGPKPSAKKSPSRPKPKKKRKKKPENQPFWKTKAGKILGGLGFLALGIAAIAYATIGDVNKPLKTIIGGICAVLLGLGSLGYGFMADDPDDDEDESSSSDDDYGGGDWGDDD